MASPKDPRYDVLSRTTNVPGSLSFSSWMAVKAQARAQPRKTGGTSPQLRFAPGRCSRGETFLGSREKSSGAFAEDAHVPREGTGCRTWPVPAAGTRPWQTEGPRLGATGPCQGTVSPVAGRAAQQQHSQRQEKFCWTRRGDRGAVAQPVFLSLLPPWVSPCPSTPRML